MWHEICQNPSPMTSFFDEVNNAERVIFETNAHSQKYLNKLPIPGQNTRNKAQIFVDSKGMLVIFN